MLFSVVTTVVFYRPCSSQPINSQERMQLRAANDIAVPVVSLDCRALRAAQYGTTDLGSPPHCRDDRFMVICQSAG